MKHICPAIQDCSGQNGKIGYVGPVLLVETDWLEAHLDDPNIRIGDYEPFDVYRHAHIKNAEGV